MIAGIGTDITRVARFAAMLERQGTDRVAKRLLAASEVDEFALVSDPARFLAKRFAAKEALSKALGTGVRAPVTLTAIAITHDELGKPGFAFSPALSAWLNERGFGAVYLSISDELEHAVAFVVVERAVQP